MREPGNDWRPTGSQAPLAGVELGGTKCVCTLAHGPDLVVEQRIVSTTRPSETLPAIAAILTDWQPTHCFRAIGIASFGPLDLDPRSATFGRITATNKPHWPDTDVRGALTSRFDVPVGFDTDVNGAALAEIRWGCAQGLDDFAYVTVGTGVGVGLIVHGRPTRGIGHSELGHIRVPRMPGDQAPSACRFHSDCVEGLASGPALALRLGSRSLERVTAEDPVWAPIVHAVAMLCHALVCASGPHRIAIGGGVVAGQPHLIARINAALIESLNGYMPLPDGNYVVSPRLGDRAGPLGSIALADAAFEEAGMMRTAQERGRAANQ